jgi:HK97 family phage major capsid protein
MDPEIRKALDDLASQWKAFRDANDARLAAIEGKQGTPEYDAKLDAINKDLAETRAKLNRMNLGLTMGVGEPQKSELGKALATWMRTPGRAGTFLAEVNTSVNTEGGYLVIPEIDGEITRLATATVVMRSLASVRTIGRPSYVKFVNKGGVTARGEDEGEEGSGDGNTPEVVPIEIFVHKLTSYPISTQEALDDLELDVAQWLAEEVGIAFAEKEEEWFISGNGIKQAKGFLDYGAVVNANYAWGKLGYTASGDAAKITPDALISLIHTLRAKYRGGASFLCNDLTLADIRKLKDDDGHYLWQPSLQEGIPDRLLGYPCANSDYMPDIAAGAFPLAFGNWKSGYQIIDRKGISILVNPYRKSGKIIFETNKRTGGDVVNFEAIKLLKIAA